MAFEPSEEKEKDRSDEREVGEELDLGHEFGAVAEADGQRGVEEDFQEHQAFGVFFLGVFEQSGIIFVSLNCIL